MENLLILSPIQADQRIDFPALIQPLTQFGLLGEPFTYQGTPHYRPGESFLQLITYLGCSPVISLGEPGTTGDEFAHIALVNTETTHLLHGDNVKSPRCPKCRHIYETWQEELPQWERQAVICPSCELEGPIQALHWRQCAGYGRSFIKIWGVFEGEALPSDTFLEKLNSDTGVAWDYFYIQLQGAK